MRTHTPKSGVIAVTGSTLGFLIHFNLDLIFLMYSALSSPPAKSAIYNNSHELDYEVPRCTHQP